ncbi:hypothetical protein RZS08_50355, partial [Arthrospira platensis SPKY1]|nr:hypothetical protein [Arthrospira platensis SPKY1]
RIATGEIRPRRAVIRHEQGIPHEHGITDPIGRAGRRVPRGMPDLHSQRSDGQPIAFGQQTVKLPAIHREVITQIEHGGETLLHAANMLADRHLATQLLLEPLGRRQVI